MVLEKLMIPFADCVASIVHHLNCSSRSAQKALAANYAITRVTIYAVRTFAFARLSRFHKFPEEGSAFANKYNYLYSNFDSRAVYAAFSRETSDAQKFQRLLTHTS